MYNENVHCTRLRTVLRGCSNKQQLFEFKIDE